jgi:hypothetical protein
LIKTKKVIPAKAGKIYLEYIFKPALMDEGEYHGRYE